jgi:hypothetical protein
MELTTVGEHFRGYFVGDYDGSYGTQKADQARRDFSRLTNLKICWSQVHGDFKNAAKRSVFVPYPHWPQLYEACRDSIRAHAEIGNWFSGANTCSKIMDDAMKILRARHGLNAPRWWLPLMKQLRDL